MVAASSLTAQEPKLRQTIKDGEVGKVNCLTISPDGKTLAESERGCGAIILWNTETGRQIGTLRSDSSDKRTHFLAFSPDSKLLAAGSEQGPKNSIDLWEVGPGKRIAVLGGHIGNISCLAFSRDGKTLASASRDTTIRLWSVPSRKEVATLSGHIGSVDAVAFNPNGRQLASGGKDKTIKLWDIVARRNTATLKVGTSVGSVGFSPDGKTLASRNWDGTVQLWCAATGKSTAVLKDVGYFVGFSQDGKTLLSASCISGNGDGFACEVTFWDIGTNRAIRTFTAERGSKGSGICMAYAPDAKALATGIENTIKLWDLKPSKPADN
jgi:WD40 repeat protein